jgi:2-oxoglutarate dehydrogenase E1 component
VVNCSTPANYYHVLRRQIHRDFRKPLVVVSPKNLLRDRRCTSSLQEMGPGTKFVRLYPEQDRAVSEQPDKVRKLLLCSGKIYYELVEERERRGQAAKDVAIVRVEQLAPFPWDKVAKQAELYKNATVVSSNISCASQPDLT